MHGEKLELLLFSTTSGQTMDFIRRTLVHKRFKKNRAQRRFILFTSLSVLGGGVGGSFINFHYLNGDAPPILYRPLVNRVIIG